jgi:hypothetical protein
MAGRLDPPLDSLGARVTVAVTGAAVVAVVWVEPGAVTDTDTDTEVVTVPVVVTVVVALTVCVTVTVDVGGVMSGVAGAVDGVALGASAAEAVPTASQVAPVRTPISNAPATTEPAAECRLRAIGMPHPRSRRTVHAASPSDRVRCGFLSSRPEIGHGPYRGPRCPGSEKGRRWCRQWASEIPKAELSNVGARRGGWVMSERCPPTTMPQAVNHLRRVPAAVRPAAGDHGAVVPHPEPKSRKAFVSSLKVDNVVRN